MGMLNRVRKQTRERWEGEEGRLGPRPSCVKGDCHAGCWTKELHLLTVLDSEIKCFISGNVMSNVLTVGMLSTLNPWDSGTVMGSGIPVDCGSIIQLN